MKSISLSTGVFVAIMGLSLPAHAETAPFSDSLLTPTSCDTCHLSPSELRTADFSFSPRPIVQIKQTSNRLHLSSSKETAPVVNGQTTAAQPNNLAPPSAAKAGSEKTTDGTLPSSQTPLPSRSTDLNPAANPHFSSHSSSRMLRLPSPSRRVPQI